MAKVWAPRNGVAKRVDVETKHQMAVSGWATTVALVVLPVAIDDAALGVGPTGDPREFREGTERHKI